MTGEGRGWRALLRVVADEDALLDVLVRRELLVSCADGHLHRVRVRDRARARARVRARG